MGLDIEGLEAEFREPRLVVRHKRKARDLAHEAKVDVTRRRQFERHTAILRRTRFDIRAIAERPLPRAFGRKAPQIDVRQDELRLVGKAWRLCEKVALFEDHRLSVPGEIGRRLPLPRSGIEIGGKAAGRMRRAQGLAVVRLANYGVGGRQIEQQSRPRKRRARRWRDRNPYVLADFHMDREALEIRGLEQHVRAERRQLPGDRNLLAHNKGARSEVALLIEFPIVREIGLGRHGENASAEHRDGAIVEPPPMAQRRPDDDDGMERARSVYQIGKRPLDSPKQRLLLQEIVDGVGGNPKLREKCERGAPLMRLPRQLYRARDVEVGIGDPHPRTSDGDADEAMGMQRKERMGHLSPRERPKRVGE